ncbi:BnaCnng51620D [Brassica napus]|uniref:Branched-chain-amino-acid aminotransferase n=1 Tax=Brassica napus TaxID=3708 RepID=A0A078JIR2_BRANA|nr:unnamed protein product [Brassica napus]CDY66609.1 BnaCnng51620D [Brassica napus]
MVPTVHPSSSSCLTSEADEKYANVNWEELGFTLIPTDYIAGILNYGQGLFEGLKVYRTQVGRITLFRPEQNALRMQMGADRLCMTPPSVDQFVEAVKQTVIANKKWVPSPGKGTLYIRPLLIGSGAVLGIASAPEYMFKSEVANLFQNFCAMSVHQFGQSVQVIRSDNGTEFMVLTKYFQKTGIIHQTSCVDTPQQNGRVERKHRHILNVARACLFQSKLPITFWGESILAAAHIINHTPSQVLDGKTPYEILHGSPPVYDLLCVFGCLAYAHRRARDKDKFVVYVSPVGNYHKGVSSGLNLKVDHTYRRAHTGGTGGVKSCTNYSPVVKSLREAKSAGFSDVLFLDAATGRNIEEVSTCNIFVVKENILSTPPISGTILPGITRKSISELAPDIGYQVQERDVSVDELLEAEEVFCTGTAVVVRAVESVTFYETKIKYITGENAFSTKLHVMLTNIQMGVVEDTKGWMVEVNDTIEIDTFLN